MSSSTLETLQFDNSCLSKLPLDPNPQNYVRTVPGACFSRVTPTPVKNPRLVATSREALQWIGLDEAQVNRPEFVEYFAGNKVLPGSEPAAHCYCGHQFGNFAGQLGDGRAMYLGEVINPQGQRVEIQFKGAGKTPYSREADGRAVLRSSIREFLCSEAMFHLGVPTTRAGTLVTSDSYAVRDINYDGHPKDERCTVVLRIAPSFIRFGSFQIAKPMDPYTGRAGPSPGRTELVQTLLDYVIQYHFPESLQHTEPADKYASFFGEVVRRTALLAAEWQCCGFTHGVLNTDNMSILGLTIDYGPFGFVESYEGEFTPNTSDNQGRYAFEKQPKICLWNLERLAEALAFALPQDRRQAELARYWPIFEGAYYTKMRAKLGLIDNSEPGDVELFKSLLATMENTGADFTNTFRNLKLMTLTEGPHGRGDQALVEYLLTQTSSAEVQMSKMCPKVPVRQLQMLLSLADQQPEMLVALTGKDVSFVREELAKHERWKEESKQYTPERKRQTDTEAWNAWLAQYRARLDRLVAQHAGADLAELDQRRRALMDATNPKFILRNHMAQTAIEKAEKGDFSEVHRLLDLVRQPFSEGEAFADSHYDAKPPDWASGICLSCSS
eukprot:TRINITY_DN5950_c0_g1_i3.p1 TRINITY_DN5950_c0_g1~~TRINITY_DN5950_c0_g1_i3.p1  ORF type:complete len:635 (-),score=138.59 TRINITY_DN5950_c0_g1_i3:30-1868(-)